jgi:hypothetical protein
VSYDQKEMIEYNIVGGICPPTMTLFIFSSKYSHKFILFKESQTTMPKA